MSQPAPLRLILALYVIFFTQKKKIYKFAYVMSEEAGVPDLTCRNVHECCSLEIKKVIPNKEFCIKQYMCFFIR